MELFTYITYVTFYAIVIVRWKEMRLLRLRSKSVKYKSYRCLIISCIRITFTFTKLLFLKLWNYLHVLHMLDLLHSVLL